MKKTLSVLAILGVASVIATQNAMAFDWSNLNPAYWGHCPKCEKKKPECKCKKEKECNSCEKVKKCDPCEAATGAAAPCAKTPAPCNPCQKQVTQPTPCDPCDKLQEMSK